MTKQQLQRANNIERKLLFLEEKINLYLNEFVITVRDENINLPEPELVSLCRRVCIDVLTKRKAELVKEFEAL